jgi:cytochrome c55X
MKICLRALLVLMAVTGVAGDVLAGGMADPASRREQILHMVKQDCGSCHGLTMKGGLGPALLPSALADKDSEQLAYVILNGRHGTPMPPWRDFLSEIEARWVVEQLKKGLPDAKE